MTSFGVATANHLTQSKSSSKVSSTRLKCHAFVDFDGTIVPWDATDLLFERFADPAWRDVEADWQAGRIGSRECLTRQVALLRAEPEAVLSAIGELRVDHGFTRFIRECASAGVDVTVVSDGFDFVIENVLRNAGVDVPFKANHLEYSGDGRWRVTFPNARDSCAALAGNCKCTFTEPHQTAMKVVVGDGRSDFCVSKRADLVFAKKTLLELCRSTGAVHFPFDNFHDVTEKLGSWLNSSAPRRVEATHLPQSPSR
jgi:2,3-diketo-5-methylthio-1-phosphopentane phosphatase